MSNVDVCVQCEADCVFVVVNICSSAFFLECEVLKVV